MTIGPAPMIRMVLRSLRLGMGDCFQGYGAEAVFAFGPMYLSKNASILV